ncbi:MAG TPA: hypothetical protein DGQ38_10620, partial [Zunongwangia profunda]|nr:hypothetical protein [Zunongwangia profunda]
ELFYPKNKQHWREWLFNNHHRKDAVWLVFYKKQSDRKTISWSDAVDEALCFGWIDSKVESIDKESYKQYFCQRKPNSTWSKINKEKIEKLISTNQMTKAGFKAVERAKQNGSWTILDQVEALILPEDLKQALAGYKNALEYFDGLSKSNKKMLLYWIISAKRQETRQKRINELAELAGKGQKPKQFR